MRRSNAESDDEDLEGVNATLRLEASEMKSLLRNINEAQSLPSNLNALRKTSFAGTEALLKRLHSSASRGIALNTVKTRRKELGANALPSSPRKTFLELFLDTFDDATLQILIVAAMVSLAIGIYDDPTTGYVEGCAILAAVLIVSVVTAINDYQKESQFRELSQEGESNADIVVVRAGSHWQIPVQEIVVGDIVCLDTGDQIPCDGVLVETNMMQVDESALTGEPVDVDKSLERDPFVLSGCTVEHGAGKFVAIAVGRDSQWGVIKSHLEKEQEQTPLQEKLDDMAVAIGNVGIAAATATFIAMMLIKVLVNPAYLQNTGIASYCLEAFIIGVTIVVVAVPEGLPLAVTISLAFSTKKMLADQNLIRHLAACETMGNATNICSDKTGTLTENRMTVVKGVFADTRCDDTIHRIPVLISEKALHYILEGIACGTTARVLKEKNDGDRPQVVGNKTEAAFLLLAQSGWSHQDNTDSRREEARFGQPNGSKLFPFSSVRKSMSVLVTKDPPPVSKQTKQDYTMYHKGAAEIVLANCTHFLAIDGSEQPLSDQKRKEFAATIEEFASGALRCVALAHRCSIQNKVNPETCTAEECERVLEKNLCLDAIAGIMDPLRPDVVQAVKTCQKAGIFVRMVTGDNLNTACAIAKQAGILTEDGLAMEGTQFRKLTPSQLDEILPRLQVLARSSPEDKHKLVQRLNGALMPETEEEWLEAHPGKDFATQRDLLLPGYKEEWTASRTGGVGEVVGVTGDGTNDGPALKAADVGLSMGLSGTDVAKKASDIIIMDDNFASIVKAVLWGRSVFDNIRKFLQFQLTVNVVALTITFLSAVVGYQPPLNAVMMLWVNLIMDTMGALALGTEPPTLELLDRRPYRRDGSLISRPMWRNILCQATYQLMTLVFLLNKGPQLFECEDGSRHHFTIIFNAFVFCQVFNEFNAREIGDTFSPFGSIAGSPMFLMVIVFTIVAQWFIVEFGGDFTQTHPLSWDEWKHTVALGAGSIPVGLIMRWIPVVEDPLSFAGIVQSDRPQGGKSLLAVLLVALIPVFAALVYQLFWEINEVADHFDGPHEGSEEL